MKTFLAVDPASRSLGLALAENGVVTDSYTIKEDSNCMAVRCQGICEQISKLKLPTLESVYIEVLNSRTHRRVLWSIGAILAGLGKFCTSKTVILDKTARSGVGKSILNPPFWQMYFNVEKYRASDKNKEDKIIAAFKKRFPKRRLSSADEAVAVMLATIIIEKEGK